MKSLIIYKSLHKGNTEKIAKRMGKILGADLLETEELNLKKIGKYDLIGFGSGIYFSKHHKSLLNLVDKLPSLKSKKVFVFSTSGIIKQVFHRKLKKKLEEKGAMIVDEFFCKGFDKYGFLRLIGGINKGRPNEDDLKRAEDFARELKETGGKKL
jgi:flavodoxin